MSVKAMIQDNTRCIGCRACMVACKEWNDLGADENSNFFAGDGYQNPRDLDEHNYTLITYREEPAEAEWVFGRQLCMHCTEPACVSVCPTGALQKLAEGPVELTESRCIGCRYCIQACPFLIPKTDFDNPFPKIHKCLASGVNECMMPRCSAARRISSCRLVRLWGSFSNLLIDSQSSRSPWLTTRSGWTTPRIWYMRLRTFSS